MRVYGVAHPELLQLRADLHHVVDLAADEVLEPLVGVETAAPLAKLDEPRPHGRAGRVDRDRVAVGPLRLRHELVTRQLEGPLLLRSPPPPPPAPQKRVEQDLDSDLRGAGDGFDQPAHHRGAIPATAD